MNTQNAKPPALEILVVDDNHDDVTLVREGFALAGIAVNIHHVENGILCMAYLRREGGFAGARQPDLVLLDVNMPQMNGRQVMAQIAADVDLQHLPVVVLSTSSEAADVLAFHRMRCNAYVVKPVDFSKFISITRSIGEFWGNTAQLPRLA